MVEIIALATRCRVLLIKNYRCDRTSFILWQSKGAIPGEWGGVEIGLAVRTTCPDSLVYQPRASMSGESSVGV